MESFVSCVSAELHHFDLDRGAFLQATSLAVPRGRPLVVFLSERELLLDLNLDLNRGDGTLASQ